MNLVDRRDHLAQQIAVARMRKAQLIHAGTVARLIFHPDRCAFAGPVVFDTGPAKAAPVGLALRQRCGTCAIASKCDTHPLVMPDT